MLRLLSFLCLVLSTYSGSAPFITPCKLADSPCHIAASKAAIPAFVTGVPELGIKPMDPLKLPLIKSEQGGLKLAFRDNILTGLKNCNVQNLKYDESKKSQSLTIKCSVILSGQYNLNGQLLILPVQGDGNYSIDIRDMVLKVTTDVDTVTGKDQQPHWHIKKWRHSYKVHTGTKFNFENLFNGNKVLGQPVLDFANSNWKEVMQEVAPPVVEAILTEIVGAVEALYSSVPLSELVLL